ncbi:MAG: transcription antitermination factor NusB [Candidatus Omnitrophica bacterium]|nr:transcription antitermination factor NusB [Candidatus Omnitrophota bacterium]
MGLRTQARQSSLQILYQIEVAKISPLEAIEDYFSSNKFPIQHKEFTESIVNGIYQHFDDLDRIISSYAKNWQISRMAIVDKNILRMGAFELLYANDIPPKVTINEAVELAKKFGDLDSPKFINGILDSVFRHEDIKKTA